MTRKATTLIGVVLIALLPVCAFASGGTESGTEASATDGQPQYGGTFTFFSPVLQTNPPSPDIKEGHFHQTQWLSPIQEQPLIGNFVEFGPRGTGEYEFQLFAFVPDKFLTGWLLESWEVHPDRLVWNVRQGVQWAADNVDYMENREVVAEDLVADLIDYKAAPAGGILRDRTGDIYATGKYTLVIEFKQYDAILMYRIGYEDRAGVSPPELQTAGVAEWKNQVGTGPFMFKEYSVGAYMRYERNPNWWWKAEIDGTSYDVPFVDELVQPIIPDVATQVAALRTAKIDMLGGEGGVAPQYWDSLAASASELLSRKSPTGAGSVIVMNNDNPPFDNVDVRRALMVGTDLKAFGDLQGVGDLPIHWYPIAPGDPDYFIPMDQLPKETQVLYKYDPKLSKKMLADAGYPNGFSLEMMIPNTADAQDRAALLKDMWTDIGVDIAKIDVLENVDNTEKLRAGKFKHLATDGPKVGDPLKLPYNLTRTDNFFNVSNYSNPEFDSIIDNALQYVTKEERMRLHKQATLIALKDVPFIPTNMTVRGHFWWPWVKNYYGERNVHDSGQAGPLIGHAWIDQKMKKSMGH